MYLTLQSPTCLVSFSRRSAGMIPCLGRCENGPGPGSGKTGGAGWDRVARKKEIRKSGGFESHCEFHFFFFFFFFFTFHFFFSFFCLNNLFFLSMLHKTLFTNYNSACIFVKLKSSLRQIKLQVLYEFKLTQLHVYKTYNLRLLSLGFTFCLSIVCT